MKYDKTNMTSGVSGVADEIIRYFKTFCRRLYETSTHQCLFEIFDNQYPAQDLQTCLKTNCEKVDVFSSFQPTDVLSSFPPTDVFPSTSCRPSSNFYFPADVLSRSSPTDDFSRFLPTEDLKWTSPHHF